MTKNWHWLVAAVLIAGSGEHFAPVCSAEDKTAEKEADSRRGDEMLAAYFRRETEQLQTACLADIQSATDWNAKRDEYRRQLFEMLGLDPLPERSELKPVITGTIEHGDFIVEKLHFQSRPGLYVTGNLYRPAQQDKPLPGVLYVCGHGKVVKNGISYGNKTHYQHHGAWLARNGYVCLVIDTLQLGEIEGLHHGTHNLNQWWWVNRGYTPAGVEAWNSIRALDYLQSRPEVDPDKLGVTGRSGGGAYSWWTAALDERIKCAIPVAGITDLQNHVVDGCVEGHCDCMFMVNTYRWDYPQVAALVSPRPLLIANTDSDPIFPLDGVVRTFEKVRRVYRLQNAGSDVGLNITAGPHIDTQELQVHALRWLDQHLKGEKSRLIETAAFKFFEPEQLKVFDELPKDQRNTTIQETFVPMAPPPTVPSDMAAWKEQRNQWLHELRAKTFNGWHPEEGVARDGIIEAWKVEQDGVEHRLYDVGLTSHDRQMLVPYKLQLHVCIPKNDKAIDEVEVSLDPSQGWLEPSQAFRKKMQQRIKDDSENKNKAYVLFAVRGTGWSAFNSDTKKQNQILRRFYLLGQTLDGMQIWDIRTALQVIRQIDEFKGRPLVLQASGIEAAQVLYASLFEPPVHKLRLTDLPKDHRQGPFLLNVDRIWTMPAAVAVAAEKTMVELQVAEPADWQYSADVAAKLQWGAKQLQIIRKESEKQ